MFCSNFFLRKYFFEKYFWWKYFWQQFFRKKCLFLTLPPSDCLTNYPHLFSAPHQWFWSQVWQTDSRTYGPDAHTYCLFYLNTIKETICVWCVLSVSPSFVSLCNTQLQKSLMRSWEEVGVVYRAVRWGKGKKKIFLLKIFYLSNTIKGTIIVCSVRSVSSSFVVSHSISKIIDEDLRRGRGRGCL